MTEHQDTLPITWATRKRASSKKDAVLALAHLWVDEPEILHPDTCDSTRSRSVMDEARLYAKHWEIPFSPSLLRAMYAQMLSDEDSWEES